MIAAVLFFFGGRRRLYRASKGKMVDLLRNGKKPPWCAALSAGTNVFGWRPALFAG